MSDDKAEHNGFEMSLLSGWEGWDQHDTVVFSFSNAVLRHDLEHPDLKAGSVVECVNFDLDKMRVDIYLSSEEEEPTASFELLMSVGKKL